MPDRANFLKRAVSYNNQLAFTSRPANNGSLMGDQDIVATKQLAIVLVGLPARGKTHIGSCLSRYLNWLGFTCSIFNVEQTRRSLSGGGQPAEFFDSKNPEGYSERMSYADRCLNDMLSFFDRGGQVGIYDATNTTIARRGHARSKLEQCGARVLFLESICCDEEILEKNILGHKLRSPDYEGWESDEAAADFKKRIGYYEDEHEEMTESEECSYIKLIDAGKQIILNEIRGYLQGKITSFLLNTHIATRTIYLSRHGESEWNATGQLGGDPNLTPRGRQYAVALAEFIRKEGEKGEAIGVWTSQLKRTRQTVEKLGQFSMCWRALNEIDAGVCEGLTYEEVEQKFPEVARERKADKLRYRYPGLRGESYIDVIHRLEPVILELERARKPMLIVAHQAVIRAIYCYYLGKNQEECPYIEIPLHTVFKLTTRAYGVEVERFNLLEEKL